MAAQLELLPALHPVYTDSRSLPPVLSFFSGAGFLDLGLIQAGFEVAWSLEADPSICEAHDFGMTSHFRAQQLTALPPLVRIPQKIEHKGPTAIMKEASGLGAKGEDFGVVGGPPCPDFSIGGKNRGENGLRGRLTRIFIDRLCELEPLYFLIENVKGLISTRKHREFLFSELWKLEEKGYAIDLNVLNALDLGVPQDRQRVFIVGVKRSAIRRIYRRNVQKNARGWFPWPFDARFDGAKKRFAWPSTNPFGKIPPSPPGIPQELCVWPLIMNQHELSRLPNGREHFQPYSKKFYEVAEGDDSRKSFKRLHRYRYSPTAAYGNNEVHLHPSLPRRISVREAMRIQTVPDSFALPPSLPLSTKFKIVGNGVPVELARRVGDALNTFLNGLSVLGPEQNR
jgi:DNA (cytosine-5)-methyltransferase 1